MATDLRTPLAYRQIFDGIVNKKGFFLFLFIQSEFSPNEMRSLNQQSLEMMGCFVQAPLLASVPHRRRQLPEYIESIRMPIHQRQIPLGYHRDRLW
jgi:hypothetical protein